MSVKSGYDFVNARFSIFEIFGNEIQNEAQKLLEIVANEPEPSCDDNISKRLQLLQRHLNMLMNASISEDKKKRESLRVKEMGLIPSGDTKNKGSPTTPKQSK